MTLSIDERARRAEEIRGRQVRHTLSSDRVEVRGANGILTFEGLASATSVRVGDLRAGESSLARDNGYDMGWYTERVMAGAFQGTLSRKPDVQLLVNHSGLPVARTVNGTLDLHEDLERGLVFEARVDEKLDGAADLARRVDSGLMDQCSFAFRIEERAWDSDHENMDIVRAELHRGDVSIVNYGANPATPVAVRSLLADLGNLTDADRDQLRHDPAVIAALRNLAEVPSADSFIEVVTELRAGAALSGGTLATHKHVLSLCAASDSAMDQAQKVLADLLGVPNPDVDAPSDADADPSQDQQQNGMSLDLARARAYALRRKSPRRSA